MRMSVRDTSTCFLRRRDWCSAETPGCCHFGTPGQMPRATMAQLGNGEADAHLDLALGNEAIHIHVRVRSRISAIYGVEEFS